MSSSANEKTTEVGCVVEHDAHGDFNKSAMTPGENANDDKDEEEEEDEEEDVDFNPFLKETLSPEASSSLSSEIVGDSEHGEEEITAQTTVFPEGGFEKENEHRKDVLRKTKKTKSVSMSQSKAETVREKENGSTSSGIEVNEGMLGELSNTTHSWKPITHLDDEDAICRRTRARYSLASFKLDELEAFLQETDDEDDLQNVDDEEEYRKFLAAVLQGGDCDGQSIQENENMDDEDEDNDADFEIELEEMLESDYDEGTIEKTQKQEVVRARRRPETRQNRRQKASVQYKNKLLEQAKRPLRPLLPILPCGQPVASFPIIEGKTFTLETAPRCLSSTAEDALVNGFSPHQIGQLHCLIHEHVQLLIQIFSLCILDPSRQHIASQVQGLIFEMLHKRDEVIACRSEPYPDSYFHPPYICSSVPDALPKIYPEQSASGPSSIQTVEGSFWVPSICGLVLSVMDVAPLNLVGKYMDDVYTAVQEYRQRRVESSSDVLFEREPLFPFPSFPSLVEANGEVSKGRNLPPANTVSSSLSPQPSKKSLAAALVESTKKQSVALVPKEISKLAQRFFSNFNPALFPHKPPPTAVANRVLFTDAEDELLALGMIEYNTDWKAIQQRFLPSKTKHQIFVRQKNRCSSKAPENSIKVVRRMKTSPLTAKEIECIQEGLKVFKLDWMSVWKFVVPHRDPTLLRRQWRIALGTQKSYKQDAAKKEKRRMYELKRRCKTADLANWHLDSDKEGENIGRENNSADDYVENADECYVHEGFLADWRPGVTDHGPSVHPCLNLGETHVTYDTLSREDTHIRGNPNNNGSGEAQNPSSSSMHEFPYSINNSQHPYPLSNFTGVRHGLSNTSQPNHIVSDMASKTYKSQVCLPPYRARRTNNAHLVKLAPDLPPVNLPPSVRIISQSAFRSDQSGASKKVSANGGRTGDFRQENIVPHVAQSGTPHSIKTGKDIRNPGEENVTNLNSEESHLVKDKCVEEERCSESDLQMHPLLFQAPEDGRLPYYPLNCSTNMSSSFSFFSGNQPQLNLSLFHNPHQVNRAVDCFNRFLKTKESKASCGIDFHPLLTRTEDANTDSMTAPSVGCPSVGLEGKSDQRQNSSVAVQKKSLVSGSPLTTGSLHTSSNERANELDLEIHLSSRSAKDRASGSGDVITHNSMQPTVSAANSADKTEYQDTNNIYCKYVTNCSDVVSDAQVSVMTSTSNIGDNDEHSHPEIVMEQEELSDSDEEIEEDVEFECEEMADSEGEVGSCSEQIAEMQDKEIPSPVTGKVVTDGDSDDQQQYELRTPSRAQANVCDPTMGTSPFLKLGLTNLGKEHTSISWLSLNSCAPGRPTRKKSKNEEDLMSEDPAAKNLASCRPSRSCKTPTHSTKKIAAQKPATEMAEQLSLGPLAIRSVRKPRKRPCRSNTSLNIGMTSESRKVDNKDELG